MRIDNLYVKQLVLEEDDFPIRYDRDIKSAGDCGVSIGCTSHSPKEAVRLHPLKTIAKGPVR